MSDKKTFEEFILEYTDAQLRQGGTSAQRAIAQTRQRKREEQQRQKEREQKRLGSALAKRATSTALAKTQQAGKLAKTSSALAKRVKNSSALARTKGYKEPMATQPDEKQVGQRPYSYNRGVTTLPDNKPHEKKRKPLNLKKHAKRALGLARGAADLAGKALKSGGVEGAGEVGDRDLERIQTRSSLTKVN